MGDRPDRAQLEKMAEQLKDGTAARHVELWHQTKGAEGMSPEQFAAGKAMIEEAFGASLDAGVPAAPTPERAPAGPALNDWVPPGAEPEATPLPEAAGPPLPAGRSSAAQALLEGTGQGAPPPPQTPDEERAAYLAKPSGPQRPTAYVPGHGPAPTEDGSWWTNFTQGAGQVARDMLVTGFGFVPSRSPMWVEPSDDEAFAAVTKEREARQLGPASMKHVMEWKDGKWAEAYDDAEKRGLPIYRASTVNEKSPEWMQIEKEYLLRNGWLESGLRAADESYSGGEFFHAIDAETPVRAPAKIAREALDLVGIPPPSFLGSDEEDRADLRQNIERGRRVQEQNSLANFAGAIGGAFMPGGGANAIAHGIETGLTGTALKGMAPIGEVISGRGMVSGFGLKAAAGVGSTMLERLGITEGQDAESRRAGLPEMSPGEQLWDATKSAGMAGTFAGAFGVARGASRAIREEAGKVRSAHAALEEGTDQKSTDFWTRKGIRKPEGHEQLNLDNPQEGTEAGARGLAAQEAAGVLMPQAEETTALLSRSTDELADAFEMDRAGLRDEVRAIADEVVGKGEALDQGTEEQAMRFAGQLMEDITAKNQQRGKDMAREMEGGLREAGAPDYAPVPSPGFPLREIDRMQRQAANVNHGMDSSIPTVSSLPIIQTWFGFLRRMEFSDGKDLPTAGHEQFKKAVSALYHRMLVPDERALEYNTMAIDARPAGNGMTEILLPRRLNARELTDFIRAMDEMSKYDKIPGPEASNYKQIAGAARDLRKTAFGSVASIAERQHLELVQNEQMLRALGLPPNLSEVDPGNLDQFATVFGHVKQLAKTFSLNTPEGVSVRQDVFEKWLLDYNKDLYDEFMTLRWNARQREADKTWSITMDAQPRTRASALQDVQDAITGEDRKAEGLMQSFESVRERADAAREQFHNVQDIYSLLGADTGMGRMSAGERSKMRVALNQILLEGGEKFGALRAKATPEQQKIMDVSRKAAEDVDSMFRTLGFGPTKGTRGFNELQRKEVVQGLGTIFESYKKYGGDVNFDREVNEIFREHPNVLAALQRMTKERAYEYLTNHYKEGSKHTGLKGAYFIAANDFVGNHLDAMVSREPGKVSPLDVPIPWSIGLSAPLEGPDSQESSYKQIPAAAGMEALMRAAAVAASKKWREYRQEQPPVPQSQPAPQSQPQQEEQP